MIHAIDDLWLASYLISQGARLAGVSILPVSGGSRLRAVFELADVSAEAIRQYAESDPQVRVHQLRSAINRLRDLMYAELCKRNGNGSIKQMPNGGQGRRRDYEIHQRRNR
jgi:hypothetical protein